jgi:hypothetical protein
MSAPKPHNRNGIYSSIIFFVSFGCYITAIWLAANNAGTTASFESAFKWIDNLSVIPFGVGTYLGIRALYQQGTNPMFPFMGFALNGIMVFKVVYGWLGWAFAW